MQPGEGFHHSRCDSSLFIYRQGADTAYLLLYVDDIVLTASSSDLLQQIITSLHAEFSMTDLGSLNYFLGISVTRNASGMFLSQQKYATEVLLFLTLHYIAAYWGLTVSPPLPGLDISYAVQQGPVILCMTPETSSLSTSIGSSYVRGTLSYGLQLYPLHVIFSGLLQMRIGRVSHCEADIGVLPMRLLNFWFTLTSSPLHQRRCTTTAAPQSLYSLHPDTTAATTTPQQWEQPDTTTPQQSETT
ncbi:ribonuclease H-like domain-containing protein [Tanacetum coccineum]